MCIFRDNMGKVSNDLKLEIIRLNNQGLSASGISKCLREKGHSVTRQQVNYWRNQIRLWYYVPGVTKRKKGVFKKVCVRDTKVVRRALSANQLQSSSDIHKELKRDGYDLSHSTTKKVISACGLENACPRYGQMVRDTNKEKRVNFCLNLIEADDKFSDIIFTGECSVQLHQNKRVLYREKDRSGGVLPKPKYPLKVHVWGGG